MALTKKELLRLEELETTARDNFIAYAEYNAEDYLDTDRERKEYANLLQKSIK